MAAALALPGCGRDDRLQLAGDGAVRAWSSSRCAAQAHEAGTPRGLISSASPTHRRHSTTHFNRAPARGPRSSLVRCGADLDGAAGVFEAALECFGFAAVGG